MSRTAEGMSLGDEIAAAHQSGRRQHCTGGAIEDSLTERERADLLAAFASDVPSTVIAKVLRGRGHKISDFTLNRHRRGSCNCAS